jgi:hypothetical protein
MGSSCHDPLSVARLQIMCAQRGPSYPFCTHMAIASSKRAVPPKATEALEMVERRSLQRFHRRHARTARRQALTSSPCESLTPPLHATSPLACLQATRVPPYCRRKKSYQRGTLTSVLCRSHLQISRRAHLLPCVPYLGGVTLSKKGASAWKNVWKHSGTSAVSGHWQKGKPSITSVSCH